MADPSSRESGSLSPFSVGSRWWLRSIAAQRRCSGSRGGGALSRLRASRAESRKRIFSFPSKAANERCIMGGNTGKQWGKPFCALRWPTVQYALPDWDVPLFSGSEWMLRGFLEIGPSAVGVWL